MGCDLSLYLVLVSKRCQSVAAGGHGHGHPGRTVDGRKLQKWREDYLATKMKSIWRENKKLSRALPPGRPPPPIASPGRPSLCQPSIRAHILHLFQKDIIHIQDLIIVPVDLGRRFRFVAFSSTSSCTVPPFVVHSQEPSTTNIK